MMHGKTKMVLTHASVQEAIDDWLNKHMSVSVIVGHWQPTPNTYGDDVTISIEFDQVPPGSLATQADTEVKP
jgi:hypothetical protein